MGRLEGKVALVTGASRGIGLAVAQRLVAEGARVCITARKEPELARARADLGPDRAIVVAGKVDDPAHREHTLQAVVDAYGGLDVLVNNAGINPVYGSLIDLDLPAARKLAEVNVFATLAWTQAVWHHPGLGFVERHGCVVNMSSVTGTVPGEGIGMYGITKAAISHLTRTLAVELGPAVRVNAVAPAVVRTQFAKALYEGREADVVAQYPLRRLGTPDDVAAAVAFLASADAAWMTGEVMTLDGGLLAAGGTV